MSFAFQPTEAQKQAGNYKKDHISVHGLPITIENRQGSMRRGIGADGKPWAVKMPAHYGYFKRSEGADGDHVDCYVGPHIKAPRVFVVDQKDADTGKFDEHKVMLCFASKEQALNFYRRGFSDGNGSARIGNVKTMTVDEFKDWLRNGDTTKAIKRAAGGRIGYADGGALPDAPWATPPADAAAAPALPDAPWAAPKTEAPSKIGAAAKVADEFMSKRYGDMYNVTRDAVLNAPSSAAKFATDLVHPVIHPIETFEGLKNVATGVGQKAGVVSGEESIPYADAMGQFFADRYGGMENLKKTLSTDPVGFASDLSMLLTGGGSTAARLPGVVGKVGEAVSAAGRVVDPLTAVGKGARALGSGAAEVIGGIGTHTGGESLRIAARAGEEGGEAARVFQENMRGAAPIEDAVAEARGALDKIRRERGSVYRENMAKVAADPTILDFAKVDAALAKSDLVKTFKGQSLSPKTEGIRSEIGSAIKDWKALDPKEFHTVEGLDALKQKIGDIRDATAYGTPERVVADRAYHAIRNTIIEQAPAYAKIMKGYENASAQIKEIERALSLNKGASVDTALRKLQSILRNNVNTNYGNRTKLAEYLVEAGAPNLMNRLAGQSLSSWTPRGLGKLGMTLGAEILALGGGHAAMGPAGLVTGAATLPLMSPRLMGEGAYYLGKASNALPIRGGSRTSYQAGREEKEAIRRAGTP